MATTMKLKPIPGADKESATPTTPAAATSAAPNIKDMVASYIDKGVDIAVLTKLYLKLRDGKKDLETQAKAKLSPINDGLELIENHFLSKMLEMGVDSLKNAEGTPYKSKRVSITVADNEAWVDFVLSRALESLPLNEVAKTAIKDAMLGSGQLALIEARAAKTAVEALMEETHELPPGLNRREEATVNVRKD